MYASCQSRAVGLAYTIAKAILEDKKDPEPNYTNIQTPEKDRKRKHKSGQHNEECRQKSMSKEKRQKEDNEESEQECKKREKS
uniref:Uncharacterized protein n=1 Tax=Romanomermis culicivorax TaxID=13658 RepID=A0A915JCW3_ROMCU